MLLLAVAHHLLVTARVPLAELVSLVAGLSREAAVAEYVGPQDIQFRRLCRGREHLFAGYGQAAWEQAWSREFLLEERLELPGAGRLLYWFRRRNRIAG